MKASRQQIVAKCQNSLINLCGGALALNVFLTVGLLGLLVYHGLGFFWPKRVAEFKLKDGTAVWGEIHDEEVAEVEDAEGRGRTVHRTRIKIGNRDLTGLDFRWLDDITVAERSFPEEAVVLERLEWGNFYGRMVELRKGDEVLAQGLDETRAAFEKLHPEKEEDREALRRFERGEIGDVNFAMEKLRLEKREIELAGLPEQEQTARLAEIEERTARKNQVYESLAAELFRMRDELKAETLVMESGSGERKEVPVSYVVRAYRPNEMTLPQNVGLYSSRIWEFIWEDPRESNTEGGIFPTIFGTVMMVFIMSFVVAPFGVLAAVYLREYARQGLIVRSVRIAVNNLAGVPSIVFGMFGLGFFVYLVGGSIDKLFFPESLPTPTFGTGGILWASLTLALLTVPVVIVATEEGLAAVPSAVREGSLALGATKFETLSRVVVPAAAPGIMTGMILAMARAAGEVAPLMIVGMVKLAPELPIDHHFPFIHLERKFMHLGFHIYDVGFQSPNVEATRPLVFATALLLIIVVTAVNLGAIGLRNHLRRKYASKAV